MIGIYLICWSRISLPMIFFILFLSFVLVILLGKGVRLRMGLTCILTCILTTAFLAPGSCGYCCQGDRGGAGGAGGGGGEGGGGGRWRMSRKGWHLSELINTPRSHHHVHEIGNSHDVFNEPYSRNLKNKKEKV